MFKATLAILFKFICNTVSFELFSCQKSFYLVKRSEFDHISDSLHGTRAPFHITLSTIRTLIKVEDTVGRSLI